MFREDMFKGIIASMFTDKLTVTEFSSGTNIDGSTSTSLNPAPKYTDAPCRISFENKDSASDADADGVPVHYAPKVFFAPDLVILAGSHVEIKRCDPDGAVLYVYTGVVSQPIPFASHQEAFFQIEEYA